jgi:hypothetical protein
MNFSIGQSSWEAAGDAADACRAPTGSLHRNVEVRVEDEPAGRRRTCDSCDGMAERGARGIFSDSVVKQPAFTREVSSLQPVDLQTGARHRPLWWRGAGLAPSLPLSLTCVRGAERRKALRLGWHLCEGAARRVTGTRTPGAPLAAFLLSGPLFRARTDELDLAPIQAALAPPFSPSTSSH